ncbi:Reverse transcriptase RNA-dependent DNA polymerase [Penicillium maclennaniae]|uniref:Reverse transcriptase RNA-dependent DNA polymerase n=1 Tax=Penicillium maclennaniae TaxID=1343394 RepID=UPI002541C64C|nr:Reverse transcriptase RNA-dependent DNA polymerase [Penicillium maclennaniae]KAJ5677664.1 Reverse transcriptase RNA-dependent DNA polymerase [Penicillium maclennaniae]
MRSLYGLRQAPLKWYNTLKGVLLSLSFTRTHADHSVFIHAGKRIHILVYIDDILLLSPKGTGSIELLKVILSRHFQLTDNGVMKRFLAIDIVHLAGDVYLSQEAYIDKILSRFTFSSVKPIQTPFNNKEVLSPYDSGAQATPQMVQLYQEQVSSLVWVVVSTRPDISWAVCKLAKYSHNPSSLHFQAIKRVYRYLKGSKSLCLHFSHYPAVGLALFAYVDASWASPHDDNRLSTTGYAFILAGAAIIWQSKRQTLVTLSSTEAEYVAACLCCQDLS